MDEWIVALERERPNHPYQLEIAAQIDRAAYERTTYVREWKQLFLTELAHKRKGESGMTDYTPSAKYVRDFYAVCQAGDDDERYDQAGAEFDRYLDRVKREAAAQALENAAGMFWPDDPQESTETADRLRNRADALREEATK